MQENNLTNNSNEPETSTPPTLDPVLENTSSTPLNTETVKSEAPTNSVPAEIVSDEPAVVAEVVSETVTAHNPTPNEVVTLSKVEASETTADLKQSSKKQVLIQYGIASLVVLIMGGGLLYALEQQGRIETGLFTTISNVVNPAPAAAVVNGVKISQADYEKNLTQLKNSATAQGGDIADEKVLSEIKTQAIDVLVNTELLRQAAKKDGVAVTAEQIEARYQEILETIGGAEALATKMTELGITEASLRKDIEGEILIQTHLTSAVDTTKAVVSEQEITAAYAQMSGGGPNVDVPPLAEIKPQLEAQLKFNKEQELVNAYITTLREGADIKVLI